MISKKMHLKVKANLKKTKAGLNRDLEDTYNHLIKAVNDEEYRLMYYANKKGVIPDEELLRDNTKICLAILVDITRDMVINLRGLNQPELLALAEKKLAGLKKSILVDTESGK